MLKFFWVIKPILVSDIIFNIKYNLNSCKKLLQNDERTTFETILAFCGNQKQSMAALALQPVLMFDRKLFSLISAVWIVLQT